MSVITGFPPIAAPTARLLILGTMPSVASLQKQHYYAHPHNAFWPIMGALFDFEPGLDYTLRQQTLINNHIAVWDVLQSCRRPGSLDADIELASLMTNDYRWFFSQHPYIKHLFFNGKMAEKLYRQHVLPDIVTHYPDLSYHLLPSTSPAFATLKLAQKLEAWKLINQLVVK